MMPNVSSVRVLMLVAGTMFAASGAGADTGTDSAPAPSWNLLAGAEFGQGSSRGAIVAADYLGNASRVAAGKPVFTFGLSGLHSDARAGARDTTTKSGEAHVKIGGPRLQAGIAFESVQVENLRDSKRWTGTLDMTGGGWNANITLSTRATDFASFAIDPAAGSRLGEIITLSGQANCALRDIGYGATLAYSTDHWNGYVSGSGSDYDAVDCAFTVAVPPVLRRLDRRRFQLFADTFLDRVTARAGGRIGQNTALLQRSFGAGLAHYWERASLAFDYAQLKDGFGGLTHADYALTTSFAFSERFSADLAVGMTVESSSDSPYAGLYLRYGW